MFYFHSKNIWPPCNRGENHKEHQDEMEGKKPSKIKQELDGDKKKFGENRK